MKFIDTPSFGFRWELCRGPKLLKLSCPSGLKRRSKWWRPDQDKAKILRIFRITSLLNNCTYRINIEQFLLEWVFEIIVWFFLFPGLVVLGPGNDCPIKQKFCYIRLRVKPNHETINSQCRYFLKVFPVTFPAPVLMYSRDDMSFSESPNPNPSMRYFILKGLVMNEDILNLEEIQLDVLVGHD